MGLAEEKTLPDNARILIIRFSSLGDLVKCTALPRLIKNRYPRAHVTLLTAREFVALVEGNPQVDRAIGFDRRGGAKAFFKLVGKLRQERFDLIVDVHKSLRSRALGLFLKAPHTRYNKRTWQRLLLIHFRINTYNPPRGKEEDFLAGLLPYGIRDDGRGTELNIQPLASDPTLLEKLKPGLATLAGWKKAGRPIIGIAPVAAWPLKRWPMASFQTLVQQYLELTNGGVVLFGGPDDREVESLLKDAGDRGVSMVGKTTHLESAYVGSLCDLVVSNDTGMAHLSEAVGVDVLMLFGPTSRELGYYPVRQGSEALEIDLSCRPCTRTGKGRCTNSTWQACMAGITPAMVVERLTARLAAMGYSSGGRSS